MTGNIYYIISLALVCRQRRPVHGKNAEGIGEGRNFKRQIRRVDEPATICGAESEGGQVRGNARRTEEKTPVYL